MLTSTLTAVVLFYATFTDPSNSHTMHGLKTEMSSMQACRAMEERFTYAEVSGQFGKLVLFETRCEVKDVRKEEL